MHIYAWIQHDRYKIYASYASLSTDYIQFSHNLTDDSNRMFRYTPNYLFAPYTAWFVPSWKTASQWKEGYLYRRSKRMACSIETHFHFLIERAAKGIPTPCSSKSLLLEQPPPLPASPFTTHLLSILRIITRYKTFKAPIVKSVPNRANIHT